jgi:predicted nuclease with TOPRIM domain
VSASQPLTGDELAAIKARAEAVALPRWHEVATLKQVIAHAREDVPRLVAEVERLRAQVERQRSQVEEGFARVAAHTAREGGR